MRQVDSPAGKLIQLKVNKMEMVEGWIQRQRQNRYTWGEEETETLRNYFKHSLEKPQRPKHSDLHDQYTIAPAEVQNIYFRHDSKEWKHKCREKIRSDWRKLHGH